MHSSARADFAWTGDCKEGRPPASPERHRAEPPQGQNGTQHEAPNAGPLAVLRRNRGWAAPCTASRAMSVCVRHGSADASSTAESVGAGSRRSAQIGSLLGGLVLTVAVSGCAPTVQAASASAAKGAAPEITNATLGVFEDPQTRERLAKIVASPEVQRAMQDMSAGISEGVVRGLSDEAMEARLDILVRQLTRAAMASVTKNANEELAPAVTGMTRRVVDSIIDEASTAEHREQMARVAEAIALQATRGVANEVPRSFGPALREAMQNELAPGLIAIVQSSEFKASFGELSHELSRQAVIGSNEALAELADQRRHEEGGSPLGVIGTMTARTTWLPVVIACAIAFAAFLFLLLRGRKQAKPPPGPPAPRPS